MQSPFFSQTKQIATSQSSYKVDFELCPCGTRAIDYRKTPSKRTGCNAKINSPADDRNAAFIMGVRLQGQGVRDSVNSVRDERRCVYRGGADVRKLFVFVFWTMLQEAQ